MSIYLEGPRYDPRGPDGRGRNRLTIGAPPGAMAAQCALMPTSWATLRDSHDTRRARWGGFGACIEGGDDLNRKHVTCANCPVFQRPSWTFRAFTPTILVRLLEAQPPADAPLFWTAPAPQPHIMDKPHRGWSSKSWPVSWGDLARLVGWNVGMVYRDVDSEGFWLERDDAANLTGVELRWPALKGAVAYSPPPGPR
jgi:hypothetical protein